MLITFYVSRLLSLYTEAQVKLFLAKSVYAYYNFEMPELLSSKRTLTHAYNSSKWSKVLASNYLSVTCLHFINNYN